MGILQYAYLCYMCEEFGGPSGPLFYAHFYLSVL